MINRFRVFICTLLILLIAYSCANQGNISGGPRDEEPPELLSVNPPSGSLNVKPAEIEFVFNENIDLEDIRNNLLVSPVLEYDPEVRQKAQSFTVLLKDTLLENTTYTFNFGNAITDLNEGNELNGFTYVFSTGPEIDKGRLMGSVVDATTGNPFDETENVWAVLYRSLSDTSVQTQTPNYIAPLQEDGSFSFQNIAEQEYQLFVLKDNNFNYYYDLPNESIAFLDRTVVVDTSEQELEESMPLFVVEDTVGRVLKVNRHSNTFSVETNFSGKQFQFDDSLNQAQRYPVDYFEDSTRFWLPPEAPENRFYISWNSIAIDTISVNAFDPEAVDTSMNISIEGAQSFTFKNRLSIKASQPFQDSVNTEKIALLEDSLFVAGGVLLIPDSLRSNRLFIDHKWQYGKEYSLTFDDSTFQSIYGNYSDSTTVNFTVPEQEQLGSLIVNLDSIELESNLIIQLFKGESMIEQRIVSDNQPVTFAQLNSGNYQLQVIVDENGNGEWDTGNFLQRKQPEEILRFEQDIEVRSNWDTEVNLDF